MSRYIDVDRLIDELNRRDIEYRTDIDEVIRTAPAEDVEPVKHGTWLATDNSKLLECSRCGEIIFFESTVNIRQHYRYCHRCGAKMDKEQEHEE